MLERYRVDAEGVIKVFGLFDLNGCERESEREREQGGIWVCAAAEPFLYVARVSLSLHTR